MRSQKRGEVRTGLVRKEIEHRRQRVEPLPSGSGTTFRPATTATEPSGLKLDCAVIANAANQQETEPCLSVLLSLERDGRQSTRYMVQLYTGKRMCLLVIRFLLPNSR